MGSSDETFVCVKRVKQEGTDEWDECMPLPGDIIEGICEQSVDDSCLAVKTSSEFSSQLGKISPQVEFIWIKVRRGDSLVKLQVRIVQRKASILQRNYTIQAATDHRQVAKLGDLTLEKCNQLQEMSRRVVNKRGRKFYRSGIKYDWKMKTRTNLPDQCCSVISSILFMPLVGEYCINTTTARCMAWFCAAISSGVPLVFVNIQTEQTPSMEKPYFSKRETACMQKFHNTAQIIHGIRLWFLPGLAEISTVLIPGPGEVRFGMEIKQTDEGFVCIYSVMTGSSADRAGIKELYEEAIANGFLLVISRLQGQSVMPTRACSAGLVHCCDQSEIKEILTSAMDQYEAIQLHLMAWPNQTHLSPSHGAGFAALLPPKTSSPDS